MAIIWIAVGAVLVVVIPGGTVWVKAQIAKVTPAIKAWIKAKL